MDFTEELFQSCNNNVVIEEASNIIDERSNHTLQYAQKHNVILPPEEKKIAINVSAIRKIRNECDNAKKNKFTYAELWLGPMSCRQMRIPILVACVYNRSYKRIWLYTYPPCTKPT